MKGDIWNLSVHFLEKDLLLPQSEEDLQTDRTETDGRCQQEEL